MSTTNREYKTWLFLNWPWLFLNKRLAVPNQALAVPKQSLAIPKQALAVLNRSPSIPPVFPWPTQRLAKPFAVKCLQRTGLCAFFCFFYFFLFIFFKNNVGTTNREYTKSCFIIACDRDLQLKNFVEKPC